MIARRVAETGATPARPSRAAGLLLHPSSLAGPFPIGDLGPAAQALLDWLVDSGLAAWQVLPLGPTGFGNSPYGALSSFAGNPLLISPQALAAAGLVDAPDVATSSPASPAAVDFAAARVLKEDLTERAWSAFRRSPREPLPAQWEAFTRAPEVDAWLDDWCLFAALKEAHDGASWLDWEPALRDREPAALARARRELAEPIAVRRFEQFLFFRQWGTLREAAEARGIQLIGDLPFYPALDSADVWCDRELFDLDRTGHPRHVAGVPPDYFATTGQRWGNPVYRWRRLAARGYDWWIRRLRWQLRLFHRVRLDHFRGFVSYWEIPAQAPTAAAGRWRRGPGERLFAALRRALGELPLLAEDLGLIDERVGSLRRHLRLPGMRVLQFAFDEVDSLHAPHRHVPDTVVYTGTHDNDTTLGWFAAASPETRRRALVYLGCDEAEVVPALVRAALTSVASLAVLPLQDLIGLGSETRMNVPGRESGNWGWRLDPATVPDQLPSRLQELLSAAARSAPRGRARNDPDAPPG